MEAIETVIKRIREDRGADILDIYRVCDSHDVLRGALTAIGDGHGDPKTLARATLDFVDGLRDDNAARA